MVHPLQLLQIFAQMSPHNKALSDCAPALSLITYPTIRYYPLSLTITWHISYCVYFSTGVLPAQRNISPM